MLSIRPVLLGSILILAWQFLGVAVAEDPVEVPKAAPVRQPPPPLKFYKGRLIAQTMHYTGAPWLVRDNREQEERCTLMLANLGVKRGMTICDMGCGNGFYTTKLAKMVGDDGHVYAVDIQPEMLGLLNERADKEGVTNITPVLGTFTDARLPKGKCDMILCVDVYHEFSHPEHMLAAMRQALAPGGLIVQVEFRAEDPTVPIKPEHKMSKKQVLKELLPNGFKLAKEFDKLPWQHMMFFGRDEKFVETRKALDLPDDELPDQADSP
ncbi:MAG TPA: class I SAM-dependent methyltransferase [Pirellulaceae bacterium]|nr:class I SAM-dependent methyltransferase [Pirellulaceae bacterium]